MLVAFIRHFVTFTIFLTLPLLLSQCAPKQVTQVSRVSDGPLLTHVYRSNSSALVLEYPEATPLQARFVIPENWLDDGTRIEIQRVSASNSPFQYPSLNAVGDTYRVSLTRQDGLPANVYGIAYLVLEGDKARDDVLNLTNGPSDLIVQRFQRNKGQKVSRLETERFMLSESLNLVRYVVPVWQSEYVQLARQSGVASEQSLDWERPPLLLAGVVSDPVTITPCDRIAPESGGGLAVTVNSLTSLTLSWTAADDNLTPQNKLRYRVYKATSASQLDTLAKVVSLDADFIAVDWTENLTTTTLSNLSQGTSYAYAVLVRDAAGNMALYAPKIVDRTPPVVPTTNRIFFENVAATGLRLRWTLATDNVTPQLNLKYKFVISKAADDIDTIEEVVNLSFVLGDECDISDSDSCVLFDFDSNTSPIDVQGLSSGTTYFFSIVVQDESGNRSLYAPVSQATN